MIPKFSSKEISFLKTDSDALNIKPPGTYFSDLLLDKTIALEKFEKRLLDTKIPGDNFLCAVIEIASDTLKINQERAKDIFEATFNAVLDNKRGLWENLNPRSFILVFWDYDSEKKASQLITSLKKKISASLKTEILLGMAAFPFHNFSKTQTIDNALKAIDHAAFFGPDTLINFDATSLNISGDRLYQLKHEDMAIKEYQKGLEIKPSDINLINSLGVCFGVMGKLDKAKPEFENAMKINPNEVMVIYNIGLLYKIDGDIDKAIIYLRKAHGIDENIFEVELLLGHLLNTKQLFNQALPHIEAASIINPKSGLPFRIKGEIYLELKKPKKAGLEFNKAIKLNPSDAIALSGYAKSLEMQDKNLNIALTFAKNSVALEPGNKKFENRLNIIHNKIENSTTCKEKAKIA